MRAAMILVGHNIKGVYNRYAIMAKEGVSDGLKRLAEHRTMVSAESKNEEDVSDSLL